MRKRYSKDLLLLILFLICGSFLSCAKNTKSKKTLSETASIPVTSYEYAVEKNISQGNNKDSVSLPEIKEFIGIKDELFDDEEKSFSVAVIDTGVFPHDSLKGRIIAFKDMVNDKKYPYDDNGHGTQIAGIIAAFNDERAGTGLAPFVNIVAVKAMDYNNKGKSENIAEALSWIIENSETYNIRIINLSVGFQESSIAEIKELFKKAYEKNIIVVSSVGNETKQNFYSGMDDENIILAGSVESDDENASFRIADYSHEILNGESGYKPDIYTFGTNILTIDSNATYKGNQDEKIHYTNKVKSVTGSSYSAAIVTRYICNLLREIPSLTPYDVKEAILDSDIFVSSKDGKKIIPVLRRK